MKEIEPFDESLKSEIGGFRKELEEIWPKREVAGVAGQTSYEAALARHPHLRKYFSEGMPNIRNIANLTHEKEFHLMSGYRICIYWMQGERHNPSDLVTEIELYPSNVGLICEYDWEGDPKVGARREHLPTRWIKRGDIPRIRATIDYIKGICNAV